MTKAVTIQDGLIVFFDNYFIEEKLAILILFLLTATIFDIKSRRIPNWLVLTGSIIAIFYQPTLPYVESAFYACNGLLVGLCAFIPFYFFRAMGAGDAKLMAMTGAFLGPMSAFNAAIVVLITGGIVSILAALFIGAFSRAINNVRMIVFHFAVNALSRDSFRIDIQSISKVKIPYALAIFSGTIIHLMLERSGHSIFS